MGNRKRKTFKSMLQKNRSCRYNV